MDTKSGNFHIMYMKVICVLTLSLFTFYSVVVEYNKWYEIVNDDVYKTFYDKKGF